MYPVLFRIGSLEIRTWGIFVLLGFIAGIYYVAKKAERAGLKKDDIYDLGFWILVSAIVGSRLFYILYHLSYFKEHPLETLAVWNGGLVFFGGVVFAIPTAIIFMRKKNMNFWKVADWIGPAFALGMFFGRWGCFFNGCCFGTPCTLPWCVAFKPGSPAFEVYGLLKVHPTQLYESFANLIIFFFLTRIERFKPFTGFIFVTYIFLGALTRFLDDFLRYYESGNIIGPFSLNQYISLALMVGAVITGVVLKNRKRSASS